MTMPQPIRTEPTRCQGSTVECLFGALAAVALVLVALWLLSEPALAVTTLSTAVVLAGLGGLR